MTSVLKPVFQYKVKPNKKLGQNFLTDPSTSKMIIEKAELPPEDAILEIGPGLGGLTFSIASKVKKVYAVEKDTKLINILDRQIIEKKVSNIELINADILRFDINSLYKNGKKITVIGNLPYKISSQIIVKLINNRSIIRKAVIMLQKETVQRLLAPPKTKNYGRLTAMLNYCGVITKLCNVEPHLFYPKPKVDSAVIKIDFFVSPTLKALNEKFLFTVIKAGFAQRRKNLKNTLTKSGVLDIEPEICIKALKDAEIDPIRRGETLTIEEFVRLSDKLFLT